MTKLAPDEGALRSFCARILGWSIERTSAVEHALQSIEVAASHRAPLMLLGDADLVCIAHAMHRRALGTSLGEWLQRRRTRRDSAPRRRASEPSPPIPRSNAIRRPSR